VGANIFDITTGSFIFLFVFVKVLDQETANERFWWVKLTPITTSLTTQR